MAIRIAEYCARVLATLLVLHALVFLCFDVLPDPALKLGGMFGADPKFQASAHAAYLGDANIVERYLSGVRALCLGELGKTFTGYPVGKLLSQRLVVSMPSLIVSFAFLGIAFVVGAAHLLQPVPILASSAGWAFRLGYIPPFILAVIVNAAHLQCTAGLSTSATSNVRVLLVGASAACVSIAMVSGVLTGAAEEITRSRFFITMKATGLSQGRIAWLCCANLWVSVRPLMGRLLTSLALSTVFAEISFGVTGFGAIFAEALKSGDLRLMQGWILMVGGCVAVLHRDS